MKRIFASLLLTLISLPALAQSGASVKQSGNVTPGQVPWWITSGVIGGGVSSADSPVTSFGVTNNGGNGICANSDRITAAGRNTICLGTTTNGNSVINVQNYGTATPGNLVFNVNGTPQTFPVVSGSVLDSDVPCFTGTTGALRDCKSGVALFPNTTNINIPTPYNYNSGAVQVAGGLSVAKSIQSLGTTFIGDGTVAAGFSGQVGIGLNGASSGSACGVYIDADNAGVQTWTLGNKSAVLNGGGCDPTPTWKSNSSRGWLFWSNDRGVQAYKFTDTTATSTFTLYQPGSGTGAGTAVVGQVTSGNSTWALGDASNILGGAYDATTTLYSGSGVANIYSGPLASAALRVSGPATGATATLWGPGSGTGAGTAVVGQTVGGNGIWGLGHASNLLGGSYDPTFLFFSLTNAYRFSGLTAGVMQSSANGTVSVTAGGVTCSGAPTGSFAVTNGVVTHC